MTPAQIEANIRQQFASGYTTWVGDEDVVWLPGSPEYEAFISQSVAEAVALQDAQTAAAAAQASHDAMVQQFVSGMTTLRTDLSVVNTKIANGSNLSNNEIKTAFRDLLQAVIWLGDRIADGTIVTRKP